MPKTVILSAARTPIGRLGGGLASVDATELGGTAIKAALERAEVAPEQPMMQPVRSPKGARLRATITSLHVNPNAYRFLLSWKALPDSNRHSELRRLCPDPVE